MKIAPIDIRQQRFSVKFRGFDPQEVDTFLEMVADELEELSRENGRLKEEMKKLQRDVEDLRAGESDMKKTLLAAQTLKEEISANARKESELIIRDARAKASEIIGSTKTAATGIQEELAALQRRKKQLILNIRSMLETHLRMLEAEEKSDLAFPIEPVRREPADAKGAEGQDESEPAPKPARPEAAPKKTKPPLPVSLRNDPLDT